MPRLSRQRAAWLSAWVLLAGLLQVSLQRVHAQEQQPGGQFETRVFHDAAGEHPYALFVPAASIPRPLPVVLFLHGAGEKGHDGHRQLIYGLPTALERFKDFPAYVVIPQCEDVYGRHLLGWRGDGPDAKRALAILDEIILKEPINSQKQSLCGWSMGGYGVWSLASQYPQRWNAVMVLAGGGTPSSVEPIANAKLPVWAIHGGRDALVPASAGQEMIDALIHASGQGTFTLLPDAGHECWRFGLANRESMNWLLNPTQPVPQLSDEPLPAQSSIELMGPFEPDIILPAALALRLGNDSLSVMASGIPEAVPETALQGDMPDIIREIPFGGETYRLSLTGLKYSVHLAKCELSGISGERFRVQFWLNPLLMSCQRAELHGRELLARSSDFRIVLGHDEAIPLTLEVRPEAIDSKLRLTVLRRQFEIPDGNWFIQRPEKIESFSPDIPETHLQTGLVGGLYQRRKEIEDQILEVIPGLLADLEQRLQQRNEEQLAYSIWPLPVLAPESRLMPGRIRTDRDGVSVELSLAAKFPVGNGASNAPRSVNLGQSIEILNDGRQLKVDISWDIISALSGEYARTGAARVHLLDLPQQEFHQLADPTFMASLLPAGTDGSNITGVLQLASPMTLSPEPEPLAPNARRMWLRADKVLVRYVRSTRPGAEEEIAAYELKISQPLKLFWKIDATGLTGNVEWEAGAEIVAAGNTHNDAALRNAFTLAWTRWAASQAATPINVPAFHIGSRQLIPSELILAPQHLGLIFQSDDASQ